MNKVFWLDFWHYGPVTRGLSSQASCSGGRSCLFRVCPLLACSSVRTWGGHEVSWIVLLAPAPWCSFCLLVSEALWLSPQFLDGDASRGPCHHSRGWVLWPGGLVGVWLGGCGCCCHAVLQDWSDSSNILLLRNLLVCSPLCTWKVSGLRSGSIVTLLWPGSCLFDSARPHADRESCQGKLVSLQPGVF